MRPPTRHQAPPTGPSKQLRGLQRQGAIDDTNLLSPPPVWSPQFFNGQEPRRLSFSPKSPKLKSPPVISATNVVGHSPKTPKSDSRRTSYCIPSIQNSRRTSEFTPNQSRKGSEHIGSNIRTRRPSKVPEPKKKKVKKEEAKVKEKGGMDPIPVFGGVLIASVLGGPVVFIAGLKLGMFVAIGGGIMGYTTGKMFSDHREETLLTEY